jgi:hypothetical protein
MPRREKYDSDADSESSDDGTDSDMEYELDTDEAHRLASSFGLSEKAVMETYKKQRGVCRVTRIPFAQGIYAPTVAPRCIANPVSDKNMIIVIEALQNMRQSVNLPWRPFVSLLQMVASEAEI